MKETRARNFKFGSGFLYCEHWYALVAFHAADIYGICPKDWDTQLIQQSLSASDHSADGLTAVIIEYQRALDCGNNDQAEEQLALALENQFGRRSNGYARFVFEKAYYLAWVHQDAQKAREWMKQNFLEYGCCAG